MEAVQAIPQKPYLKTSEVAKIFNVNPSCSSSNHTTSIRSETSVGFSPTVLTEPDRPINWT